MVLYIGTKIHWHMVYGDEFAGLLIIISRKFQRVNEAIKM